MKASKFIIPLLLLMVWGCGFYKYNHKEEIITGEISLVKLKNFKWFRVGYKNYELNKTLEDSLSLLKNLKIIIVGGNWCNDTKLYLPQFIKILDGLGFHYQNLKIVFVDRTKLKPSGFEGWFDTLNIKFIPTFIVLNMDGTELGRIIESPKLSLESDLIKIINQP